MSDFLDSDSQIQAPMFDEPTRSAIQLLRRMLLMRWSTGSFLTANAGNYSLKRPALGFSDDDIFRATAQVIMADYKNISKAIWQLCEILIGPYEHLYFQLAQNANPDDPYLSLEPFGDYLYFSNLSGPLSPHEILNVTHPTTKQKAQFVFIYNDTINSRIFLKKIASSDPGFSVFPPEVSPSPGLVFHGVSSGNSFKAESRIFQIQLDRLPPLTSSAVLYTPNIADPLDHTIGTHMEFLTLVTPSGPLARARTKINPTMTHLYVHPSCPSVLPGSILKIIGQCWEMIESPARNICIKILCPQFHVSQIPGTTYLHHDPAMKSQIQHHTQGHFSPFSPLPVSTDLAIKNFHTEEIVSLSYPRKVVLDPDGRFGPPVVLEASSFNNAGRKFVLSAPMPYGRTYPKGTELKWFQAESGQVTQPAVIGDTEIQARLRTGEAYGIFVIDPGGANEEYVMLLGSDYWRAHVGSDVRPTDTKVLLDREYPNPTWPGFVHFVTNTGTLGFAPISSISGSEVILSAPAGVFTTVETHAELVLTTNIDNKLRLSRPLTKTHGLGESIVRFLGLPTAVGLQPDWDDHLPEGEYPPGAPDGRWPGMYMYDPSMRGAINDQGSGLVECFVDRSVSHEMRSYLGSTVVGETFNPSTAVVVVPATPTVQAVLEASVKDASSFPTQADVQAWIADMVLNPRGKPPRMVMGGEGWFGRSAVSYLGKGAVGTNKENIIYVRGVQRIHQKDSLVGMYLEEIAVQSSTVVWGTDPGFDLEDGDVMLDFGTTFPEYVQYDELRVRTPTQAFLYIERGFVAQVNGYAQVQGTSLYANDVLFGHDPRRMSHLDQTETLGVRVVRSDKLAIPREDGFSFPVYLGGDMALLRLKYVLELVRAAGVMVELYDHRDRLIFL